MAIASLDEVSDFLRRLGIDDTAKFWRLTAGHAHHATMIRNHSDLNTAKACVTGKHLLSVVSLELVEMSVVE